MLKGDRLADIIRENVELCRIFTASLKTARSSSSNENR